MVSQLMFLIIQLTYLHLTKDITEDAPSVTSSDGRPCSPFEIQEVSNTHVLYLLTTETLCVSLSIIYKSEDPYSIPDSSAMPTNPTSEFQFTLPPPRRSISNSPPSSRSDRPSPENTFGDIQFTLPLHQHPTINPSAGNNQLDIVPPSPDYSICLASMHHPQDDFFTLPLRRSVSQESSIVSDLF